MPLQWLLPIGGEITEKIKPSESEPDLRCSDLRGVLEGQTMTTDREFDKTNAGIRCKLDVVAERLLMKSDSSANQYQKSLGQKRPEQKPPQKTIQVTSIYDT